MLVLGRRENESVLVGENIRVLVVAIHEDYVRLGFVAPGDVAIDREEVREAKRGGAARDYGPTFHGPEVTGGGA